MKQRLIAYGALLIALSVAFGAWFFLFRDAITHDSYLRIKAGMSRSEVHAIIAGPLATPDAVTDVGNGTFIEHWYGRRGTLMLHFDENNMIIWKEWDEFRRREYWWEFEKVRE